MFKKLFSVVTAVVLSVSAAAFTAGCSNNKTDPAAIQISVAKLGYGTQWLHNLAEAYTAKTGVNVQITEEIGQEGNSKINTAVKSLVSDIDIAFQQGSVWGNVYDGSVSVDGVTYDTLYADLAEVYEYKPEGENGLSIYDKMDSDVSDQLSEGDKFYGVPWATNFMGIVINNEVWRDLGFSDDDIPLTSDELFDVCNEILTKNAGVSPFIYCSQDEYYTAFSPLWVAQYEGRAQMDYFMQGRGPDGTSGEYLYTYDGMLYALEAMERLIATPGYQDSASASLDFSDMQGYFLQGRSVFCVNGSWLEVEMSNYTGVDVNYIRTPVISAIVNKTPSIRAAAEAAGKDADDVLADIIAEIDTNGDITSSSAYPTVKADDIAIIKEARSLSYIGSAAGMVGYVPAYSDKIEQAKDFLKFMFSDEGLNIYYETLNGVKLPCTPANGYTADIEETPFRKAVNEAQESGYIFNYEVMKNKIFTVAGVDAYFRNGTGSIVSNFLNGSHAQQILSANTNNIQSRWNQIRQYL